MIPPIYEKDPPCPFESDGSVEGEEMEDEAMATLDEMDLLQLILHQRLPRSPPGYLTKLIPATSR